MPSLLGTIGRIYVEKRVRTLFHKKPFSVEGFRASFARTQIWVKGPSGCKIEQVQIAGVRADWIIPPNISDKKQMLLYFHGGGFVLGALKAHYHYCSDLSKKLSVPVLMVHYRLAPENPYPAGAEDCLAVYREIIKDYKLALGGDSAGAYLALATVVSAQKEKLPLPNCLFVLSPASGDLFPQVNSVGFPDRDQMFSKPTLQFFINSYFGKMENFEDAEIIPMKSEFKGFPPMVIVSAKNELLHKDCLCIEQAARKNGVHVVHISEDGLFHVYPLAWVIPEAKRAREKIAEFIRGYWG